MVEEKAQATSTVVMDIVSNQQKNHKELRQPFSEEVFYALLDYLKNARPVTHYDNIFVRFSAPFSALVFSPDSITVESLDTLSRASSVEWV